MTLPIGTLVMSTWDHRKKGTIVGYGSLVWPSSTNCGGDAGIIQLVYLVQVAEMSSSLGPACLAFRSDRVVICES